MPPRPVTVGLDGSRPSLAAARWAADEAQLLGLPLRLVHAWAWQLSGDAPPVDVTHHRHWAERVTEETADELRHRHPGLDITTEQIPKLPVPALIGAAEQSEMLVLGSRGLSRLAGFLVGSVALDTVARAPAPVVLVRADEADTADAKTPKAGEDAPAAQERRPIVVGLDLDHRTDPLLEFAFATAVRRKVPLRVIRACDLAPVYGWNPGVVEPGLLERIQADEERALTEVLAPWRQKYPEAEVTGHVLPGRPAHHLVDAAAGAALLVVGRQMRERPFGARLGSVAYAVLHHAVCPVAVVPHT